MKHRIYLDHNATTILRDDVIEVMSRIQKEPYNASATHSFGREAHRLIEQARKSIANALGINKYKDDYRIVFTGSGTEANNLVMYSYQNYHMVVSSIEHASILKSATQYEFCEHVPVSIDGKVRLDILEDMLERKPKGKILVSVMAANNETGIIQEVKDIARVTHQYGGVFHCDAIQAFGKMEINLQEWDADIVTISSHKCGGPVGAACLVIKNGLTLKPMLKGGEQEQNIRAGTENIAAIAGMAQVADNIQGVINTTHKLGYLRDAMESQLQLHAGDMRVIGQNVPRVANTSCLIMPGVPNETQLINFDLAGIAISTGSACAAGRVARSHVLEAMGLDDESASCAIRVSLGAGNSEQDIANFINVWKVLYDRTRGGVTNSAFIN